VEWARISRLQGFIHGNRDTDRKRSFERTFDDLEILLKEWNDIIAVLWVNINDVENRLNKWLVFQGWSDRMEGVIAVHRGEVIFEE